MSKATVQMCMSTTGFGFELDNSGQHSRFNTTSNLSSTNVVGETTYPEPGIIQLERPRQDSPLKARRPPPKFDMNLRDLFPDDITNENLASQSSSQRYQPQSQTQQSQLAPMQRQRLSPQYPPQQQRESLITQINSGLGINASQQQPGGNVPPYLQQQQRQQPTQGSLPAPSSPLYNPEFFDLDLSNVPGLDFLQSSDFDQNLDTTGIDLGFGPGLDFQHDWSDGTGVDIFDGFFFGNAAG